MRYTSEFSSGSTVEKQRTPIALHHRQQKINMTTLLTRINRRGQLVQDPPLAQKLFNSTLAAWLWLPFRLWLGYKWIDAALHK